MSGYAIVYSRLDHRLSPRPVPGNTLGRAAALGLGSVKAGACAGRQQARLIAKPEPGKREPR